MTAPEISSCPSCGDDILLAEAPMQIASFVGVGRLRHVTCDSEILLIPGIDFE